MFRAGRNHHRYLRALADEDLMELVRTGDAAAFEVVSDRHADASFSLAYRMCGSRPQAEDVVQDAFLSLWRAGTRYDRTRGSVRSWILGVVHNRGVDVFRYESLRPTERDDGLAERVASQELTHRVAERHDDARQVRVAMGELPSEQRQVIELAYFGGFTHTEIARMLEIPSWTVKGRMRLGLSKLHLSLAETGLAA